LNASHALNARLVPGPQEAQFEFPAHSEPPPARRPLAAPRAPLLPAPPRAALSHGADPPALLALPSLSEEPASGLQHGEEPASGLQRGAPPAALAALAAAPAAPAGLDAAAEPRKRARAAARAAALREEALAATAAGDRSRAPPSPEAGSLHPKP
jgi:hypothetical protein